MSNNTGSIEQTRTQCLVVCDWLETVFKEMRDQLKREIAISTKKLNENMARSMKAFYEENAARNWLIKLLHPLKIVINFFAMTVFHIDHEFLDFASLKILSKAVIICRQTIQL